MSNSDMSKYIKELGGVLYTTPDYHHLVASFPTTSAALQHGHSLMEYCDVNNLPVIYVVSDSQLRLMRNAEEVR
jgi:hypothetical protein